MEPKELTIWALNQMIQETLQSGATEDASILSEVLNSILVDPGQLFTGIKRKEGQ